MNKKSIISFMVLNVILITSMLLFLDRDKQLFGVKEACAQAACVPLISQKICEWHNVAYPRTDHVTVPDTWTKETCRSWASNHTTGAYTGPAFNFWRVGCLQSDAYSYGSRVAIDNSGATPPSTNCGW